MVAENLQQDRESLQASRQRIKQMQQAAVMAKSGSSKLNSAVTKKLNLLAGLKDLDGLQIFFIGVAALKDFVDFVLGLITVDFISVIDWIIDIPLLIFFILIATVLVLSNPSSIKAIIVGLFIGPATVGLVEISPLGILPTYLAFALWLVSEVNRSRLEQNNKDLKKAA